LVILDPTIGGNTVTLPIHLQGNVHDGVAALDFRLSFDTVILQPVQVQPGEAAANAGKEVQAHLLADGQYEVLMFGLERNALAQGEVARITLNKIGDPKDGETPVSIGNTKLATISGAEIPSQGSTITLLFESDSESGGAGGLPPDSGEGSSNETTTTRNTESVNASSTTSGSASSGAGQPAGGPGAFDLPKAQAAAEARLSMLRDARAEREVARASVEGQSPDRVDTSEIRVRRDSGSARPIVIRGTDSGGKPTDTEVAERRIDGRQANEMAQRAPEIQPDGSSNEIPEQLDLLSDPSGLEPVIDDRPSSNSSFSRTLRMQAGFMAACIAVALGIFTLRRRRGP
jgi:hypothetical protein